VESDETPLAPAAVEDDETLVMARG
jgi:hypothetical protein